MSQHDDDLSELGKQLPWDRPDDARREAVRSSLLVAASTGEVRVRTRWFVIGGAFAAGAVAAAAAMVLVIRGGGGAPQVPAEQAQIEASSAADFERTVTRSEHGRDEVVRVHTGKISLAVGALPIGDRVRVATRDAEVEGEGSYAVSVTDDTIREVTVSKGRATVRVAGQQAVFLAAGETWKAAITTTSADLVPTHAASEPVPAVATTEPQPVTTQDPTTPSHEAIATHGIATHEAAAPHEAVAPHETVTTHEAVATRAVASHGAVAPHETIASHAAVAAHERTAPATKDRAIAADPPLSPVTASTTEHAAGPAVAVTAMTPAVETPDPKPSPPGPSATEKHFQAGWQLLKAGKPAEAARELGVAADSDADNPLATDARYFQAIALTKSGRKTEAEHALVAFLDHAKQSLRRGRAAVMLARLIAERGDVKSARAWFESALHDADPGVVAAARAGLDGLHE